MLPDKTYSARRQKLVRLPPDRKREILFRRAFAEIDADVADYLSRLPGMTRKQAQALLYPHSYDALCAEILPRYHALNDFEAAAERIADAVEKHEHIGISGDYDCDGNCSTALMIRFLKESGVGRGQVHVHIPNREAEGYGVNRDAVAAMEGRKVSLLIALDNGTLAREPLGEAKRLGMDALVIDHHPNSVGHPLPDNALVVNPRRHDEALQQDEQGIGDMAAVGMTWLVCRRAVQKLNERGYYRTRHISPPDPRDWLGLVATATIGDVVSMRAPINRTLVKEGLKVIREGRDPYLSALARTAQSDPAELGEEDIAFRLAPIINAPGRLGQSIAWAFLSPADASDIPIDTLVDDAHAQYDAMKQAATVQSVQLRHQRFRDMNDDSDRALDKAAQKELPPLVPDANIPISPAQQALMVISRETNEMRKAVEAGVMRMARPRARQWLKEHPDSGTLMLWGDHWHEGVIGIVAGRLKEEFGLPTIVASHDPATGMCKASARSIRVPGHAVDIGQAVRDMAEKDALLTKGGGHPMAAGMSFAYEKREAIRARFEEKLGDASRAARRVHTQPLAYIFDLSQPKAFADARHWAGAQERLRPYGEGFTKPRIGLTGFEVQHIRRSRDGRHLFFELRRPLPLAAFLAKDPQESTSISCQAFHAAGTEVESMLRQAETSKAPMLISGVLGLERNTQGREPSLRFQAEDIGPHHLRQLMPTKAQER